MTSSSTDDLDLLSKIERGGREREEFEEQYELRTRVLEAHVHTALEIFEDESSGLKARFIQHIPVSSRIKEFKSAIGSLRRRQNDRKRRERLKKRFESLPTGGRGSWEKYWTNQGKGYLIKDVGVFPDYDTMLEALHDIGGLRVCVYFPEDVKQVIEFIKDHPDIEDDPIIAEWGPGASPEDDLETYLDNIDERAVKREDQDVDVSPPVQSEARPFGGYRATHVRLKVKASSVDWNKTSFLPSQRPRGDFTIEVQISTAVMHAWAQVEQDIIYKPKQGPASQGLRNTLDIFNGIVAIGETALKQLALIQAEERERSAEAENALAEDRDILSSWIWKACREASPTMKDPRTRTSHSTRAWAHLGKLLRILQSSANHSYGAISRLVKSAIKEKERAQEPVTCEFALDIMAALAKEGNGEGAGRDKAATSEPSEPAPMEDEETTVGRKRRGSDAHGALLRKSLRAEVLYIVEVLKMAIFLGLEGDFMACARLAIRSQNDDAEGQKTPSLLDMLDLLHPQQPTLCNAHYFDMKLFCDRFRNMNMKSVAQNETQLFRATLPGLMVDSGYSAQPILFRNQAFPSNVPSHSVVPRELCALLDDPDQTHWIPEILVLVNEMAGARGTLGGRRDINAIRQTTTKRPYVSATGRLGQRLLGLYEPEPAAPPATKPTNQDVIYDLLRDFNRFSFELENSDSTKLSIDHKKVPLTWAPTDGVPSLHVDKKARGPRPHPGYFRAVITDEETVENPEAAAAATAEQQQQRPQPPTNGWIYHQSRAASWIVRWQDRSAPPAGTAATVAVGMKNSAKPGVSAFLGFAKRLNAAHGGSVEEVGGDYAITSRGVRFSLLSTPDEYILRQEG